MSKPLTVQYIDFISILWHVLTYTCLIYLLLALKSSIYCLVNCSMGFTTNQTSKLFITTPLCRNSCLTSGLSSQKANNVATLYINMPLCARTRPVLAHIGPMPAWFWHIMACLQEESLMGFHPNESYPSMWQAVPGCTWSITSSPHCCRLSKRCFMRLRGNAVLR